MGTIHAGKRIKPGGRYDQFLTLLREVGEKGATTKEILNACSRIANVSALASELRAMGYTVDCDEDETSTGEARRFRYWLRGEPAIKTPVDTPPPESPAPAACVLGHPGAPAEGDLFGGRG